MRLLEDVRREHPHLKLVEDGLAGPHFLKGLDLRLGAKPGDHKFLFEWVNSGVEYQEFTDENDIRHEFRYGVPLNDTHFEVNFLEYWEKRPNGKKQRRVTGAVDARRRALEDRERNFQYPEEPRLRFEHAVTARKTCRPSSHS